MAAKEESIKNRKSKTSILWTSRKLISL